MDSLGTDRGRVVELSTAEVEKLGRVLLEWIARLLPPVRIAFAVSLLLVLCCGIGWFGSSLGDEPTSWEIVASHVMRCVLAAVSVIQIVFCVLLVYTLGLPKVIGVNLQLIVVVLENDVIDICEVLKHRNVKTYVSLLKRAGRILWFLRANKGRLEGGIFSVYAAMCVLTPPFWIAYAVLTSLSAIGLLGNVILVYSIR